MRCYLVKCTDRVYPDQRIRFVVAVDDEKRPHVEMLQPHLQRPQQFRNAAFRVAGRLLHFDCLLFVLANAYTNGLSIYAETKTPKL